MYCATRPATALLRQGAALDTIGAVLRHRCIESTAHYAKVDEALLRAVTPTVARRWRAIMLSQAIDSYIAIRRAAGFHSDGRRQACCATLPAYATDRSQAHVRRRTAIAWAAPGAIAVSAGKPPRHGAPVCVPQRAPRIQGMIPSPGTSSPTSAQRAFPYLFSTREHCVSFSRRPRASGLGVPCGHTTYYTLFGLLAATGWRISEAMHLLLSDVTTDGFVVRHTKFRKSRLVPLHPTTVARPGPLP